MKKELYRRLIRISLVLVFILASNQWIFLAAETVQILKAEPEQTKTKSTQIFSIKIKGAYFFPSRTTFRDMYKNRLMGEGEFTVRVFKFIELWLGVNYYGGKGELPFSGEDTNMSLLGIGGGLKFRAKIGAFSPYLGFGPLVYFYKEENPIGTAKGNQFGFIGHAGSYLFLSKSIFLDVFLSYTKNKVQPQRIKADLGGLYGGIGLGFTF